MALEGPAEGPVAATDGRPNSPLSSSSRSKAGRVDDFTHKLFAKWGVGQKGKNNGLMLLVALPRSQGRDEVGYGLEPILPDTLAGRVLDEQLFPAFKQQRYAQGLTQAVDRIAEIIERGQPARGRTGRAARPPPRQAVSACFMSSLRLDFLWRGFPWQGDMVPRTLGGLVFGGIPLASHCPSGNFRSWSAAIASGHDPPRHGSCAHGDQTDRPDGTQGGNSAAGFAAAGSSGGGFGGGGFGGGGGFRRIRRWKLRRRRGQRWLVTERTIVMTPEELVEQLEAAIPGRLRAAVLYGSAAAGDFVPERRITTFSWCSTAWAWRNSTPWPSRSCNGPRPGNRPPLLFTAEQLTHSADGLPHRIARYPAVASRAVRRRSPGRHHDSARAPAAAIGTRTQGKAAGPAGTISARPAGGRGRWPSCLLARSPAFWSCFARPCGCFKTTCRAHKIEALRQLAQHIPFDPQPLVEIDALSTAVASSREVVAANAV